MLHQVSIHMRQRRLGSCITYHVWRFNRRDCRLQGGRCSCFYILPLFFAGHHHGQFVLLPPSIIKSGINGAMGGLTKATVIEPGGGMTSRLWLCEAKYPQWRLRECPSVKSCRNTHPHSIMSRLRALVAVFDSPSMDFLLQQFLLLAFICTLIYTLLFFISLVGDLRSKRDELGHYQWSVIKYLPICVPHTFQHRGVWRIHIGKHLACEMFQNYSNRIKITVTGSKQMLVKLKMCNDILHECMN